MDRRRAVNQLARSKNKLQDLVTIQLKAFTSIYFIRISNLMKLSADANFFEIIFQVVLYRLKMIFLFFLATERNERALHM